LKDPLAVALVVVVVGKYYDALPSSLPYLGIALLLFFLPIFGNVNNLVKLRILLLREVVQKKLSSVFIEIKIALIISREAYTEDNIIVNTPAEAGEIRWGFELLVESDSQDWPACDVRDPAVSFAVGGILNDLQGIFVLRDKIEDRTGSIHPLEGMLTRGRGSIRRTEGEEVFYLVGGGIFD
jgi:hypothetical protein